MHLWSYKDGDAKWPLSQDKSLERAMAQTPSPCPFSRTQDTDGATPLCKSPFSRHQACPWLWGHKGKGQAVHTGGFCLAPINNPRADVQARLFPQHPFPHSCKPQHPPGSFKGPMIAGTMAQERCVPVEREQESSGQPGTPRAGERGLCPLLCPSVRHMYPEPPPKLTAPTHPSHHLLSLQGGGGDLGE